MGVCAVPCAEGNKPAFLGGRLQLGEELLLDTLIKRVAHVKRVICVVNPKAFHIWLWKYSSVLVVNMFLEVFTPPTDECLLRREAADDLIILLNEPTAVAFLITGI